MFRRSDQKNSSVLVYSPKIVMMMNMPTKQLISKSIETTLKSNNVPPIVHSIISFFQEREFISDKQKMVLAKFIHEDWKKSKGYQDLPTSRTVVNFRQNQY